MGRTSSSSSILRRSKCSKERKVARGLAKGQGKIKTDVDKEINKRRAMALPTMVQRRARRWLLPWIQQPQPPNIAVMIK